MTSDEVRALPALLEPKDATEIANVNLRQMYRMCQRGDVKAVKLGSLWRVNRDSLLAVCGLAEEAVPAQAPPGARRNAGFRGSEPLRARTLT